MENQGSKKFIPKLIFAGNQIRSNKKPGIKYS